MANDLQLFTGDDDEKLPVAPGFGAMPALVLSAGEHGTYRFLEFFAAHIRNPNTRAAYFRDVCAFFLWCQRRKIRELSEIRSHHVAGYVERLGKTHAPPSVKQHLAAIRMLFDWLVIGQIVPSESRQRRARAQVCGEQRQDAGALGRRSARAARQHSRPTRSWGYGIAPSWPSWSIPLRGCRPRCR